jgi:broad specificity phosphatase PhoE
MAAPTLHPGFGSGIRLWLLRHAEVDPAWRGRAYGDLDVPLSDEGRAATEELARDFEGARLAHVYSSPLSRAAELGRAVAAAAGAPLTFDRRLLEVFRGSWQGKLIDDLDTLDPQGVAAFYADPWTFKSHGGESDEDIHARAWPAVEAAASLHPGGTVVFATHYNVIRVLAAHLLGFAPARSFAFRVDPGRASLFLDGEHGWTLRTSNALRPRHAGITA